MRANKIIITGTGKSGTTFLVHLLTALGLDTGYDLNTLHEHMSAESHGGLEWPIRGKRAVDPSPYIIKNPSLCYDLQERTRRWDWHIEHVYVSFRKYEETARHRYLRNMRVKGVGIDSFIEGLEGEKREKEIAFLTSLNEVEQINMEAIRSANQIGRLMEQLIGSGISYTFIQFPQSVLSWKYCQMKLEKLVSHIPGNTFLKVFDEVADIKKIRYSHEISHIISRQR